MTVVLIGADTYGKKWINYEITNSWDRGNGLLGIYIDGIKNAVSQIGVRGANPFSQWTFKWRGNVIAIPVYSWAIDDGYKNMGVWIEVAAKDAGR